MPQPHKGVRVQHTTRIPADLHRAAVGVAARRHLTLNDVVCEALRKFVRVETGSVGADIREDVNA